MSKAPEAPHFTTDLQDPYVSTTEDRSHDEGGHHGPTALGLQPFQWVSISMLLLILIAVFVGKVHKVIGGGLDGKIAAIRTQLDEAKQLRAEAETLRNEYAAKIANAEKDAEAMIATAQHEAEAIVAKAARDTEEVIARRQRMAEDKIAAAERGVVEELRARAATAAATAARGLIAERHDASADRKLVDDAIAAI